VSILCQRSKCLLKMESHYLALEDAKRALQLEPDHLLAHQRSAEVFLSAGEHAKAHESYLKCFSLTAERAEKDQFMELMKACKREAARKRAADEQYPWLGAALGIALTVALLVVDQLWSPLREPALAHPLAKAAAVLAGSGLCYAVVRAHRW